MSQDIAIKEGELSRQFGHINKLKIAQSGGGDTLWVPEDEVQTDTLFVDKNGVYDARTGIFTEVITKTKKTKKGKKKKVTTYVQHYDEDLICYGWDEVQVNIIDAVTGKDANGNEHAIGVDGGYLTDEMVPSYIEIVTPPDRTSYYVGEVIDSKGMVVKAYYADGTEWGEVPREEYTLDPMVAQMNDSGLTGRTSQYAEDTIYSSKQFTLVELTDPSTLGVKAVYTSSEPFVFVMSSYLDNANCFVVSKTQNTPTVTWKTYNADGSDRASGVETVNYLRSITYDDKTAYVYEAIVGTGGISHKSKSPEEVYYTSSLTNGELWTIAYGEITEGGSGVTVKWNRPSDNQELTDTFDITVQELPVPTGGGSSSEGSSEPIITPHI